MERYRIAVGHEQGAGPTNIVGAIANEGDIESCYIGHIEIFDRFSTVDLPTGMPRETLQVLQNARIFKHKLEIRRLKPSDLQEGGETAAAPPSATPHRRPLDATKSDAGPSFPKRDRQDKSRIEKGRPSREKESRVGGKARIDKPPKRGRKTFGDRD
jgi:ATP-dependent RNA helicase DeaD